MVNSAQHLKSVTSSRGEDLVVAMQTTFWRCRRPSGSATWPFGTSEMRQMLDCRHRVGFGSRTVVASLVAYSPGLAVACATRTSRDEVEWCIQTGVTRHHALVFLLDERPSMTKIIKSPDADPSNHPCGARKTPIGGLR